MAMSLAVAALRTAPVTITGAEAVAISYPTFGRHCKAYKDLNKRLTTRSGKEKAFCGILQKNNLQKIVIGLPMIKRIDTFINRDLS